MAWFRIDNRLVHGQVIEGWIPYLDASHLIIVNDDLAMDMLQQQIMRLAIPGRISVLFIRIEQARRTYDTLTAERRNVLFLFSSCQDVRRVAERGVSIPLLNVGNMHYARGKRQLCPHVAVSDADSDCLDFFKKAGTYLDFRSVPSETPIVGEW